MEEPEKNEMNVTNETNGDNGAAGNAAAGVSAENAGTTVNPETPVDPETPEADGAAAAGGQLNEAGVAGDTADAAVDGKTPEAREHAPAGRSLYCGAVPYAGTVLRPGAGSGDLGILPEWPEKYARDMSAESLGMKKLEGFREVDPEKHRRKIAAREKKKRRNKIVYIAVQSVLAAIMLFAVAKLGENYKSNVQGREHQQEIKSLLARNGSTPQTYATPERTAPAYPMATPKRIEYPSEEFPVEKSDLLKLREMNSDFKFWLYLPDSEVSYYVLQGKTNDDYLRSNIKREYVHSGSLFLDYRCNAKTMAGHTIIYGHTMNDLSMFGELRDYMSKDYYDTHRYFYTLSPETVTMWRVYSVYITTIDEYYIETYFRSPAAYLNFINGFKGSSMYPSDIDLVETDDVLTLSTCYRPYHGADGRLVVHAVKVGTTPMI